MQSKYKVVVRRTDGLGARTLALIRVWRFAQAIGAEVEAWWPSLAYSYRDAGSTDWTPERLFDLAASDLAGLRFVTGARPEVPEGCLYIEKHAPFAAALRQGLTAEAVFAHGPVVEAGGQALLRVAGEDDATVRRGLAAAFDRLVPAAEVRDALAAVRATGEPYAAIHIRRGDVLALLLAAVRDGAPTPVMADRIRAAIRRCPPVPLLLAAADARMPGGRVMVFGDDPPLVAAARAALGPRVIDQEPAAAGLEPLRRALYDIHLLRGAGAIALGSSAFTQLPLATGRGEQALVEPSGDYAPWAAMFEAEVLDAAGVAAADRPPLRALHLAEWRPMADRGDIIAARAAARRPA